MDRDKIIKEIIDYGYPAFHGGCTEIYLEKCFKNFNYKRLPNAKKLGEKSIMFLVDPTISDNDMNKYASTVANVLNKASK